MANSDSMTVSLNSGFERFLDAHEAADYLGGLNSRTVTRWAREGYLPSYSIGEGKRVLWRFRKGDLEAWLLARGSRRDPVGPSQLSDRLSQATDAPIRRIS
jgi:excisionase family DNA binding protein